MVKLTNLEQDMLDGKHSMAAQRAMEILVALGKIYNAEYMVDVKSVQISGVSYDNLGEAGCQFLEEVVQNGGRVIVPTTLNPAGMDVENWRKLGIDEIFARNQMRVLNAYQKMGVNTTCSCTPYLVGNLPSIGDHIAWAESSAVCYVNSVLGARTNREGGPSALASAITGKTPKYGMHLDTHRKPTLTFEIFDSLENSKFRTHIFGALGKIIGEKLTINNQSHVPLIIGIPNATLDELKSFSASIATYGGAAIFHMEGITPEASHYDQPIQCIKITKTDLDQTITSLSDVNPEEVDFLTLGCPHLSLDEIAQIASFLDGRRINREFWITTARPIKKQADILGYTEIIESSGAKFAVDTCCVVAPIRGRFYAQASDSAKACYYGYAKNEFKTLLLPFDKILNLAVSDNNHEDISRS